MANRKVRSKIVELYGSQADFSQAVGRDEPFVSRVLNGRRQLTGQERALWASVLGCSLEELQL